VLVAKIAPLEKFVPGKDLFAAGGLAVIGAFALAFLVIAGIFGLINFVKKPVKNVDGKSNSIASMMYGAAAGLTVTWILNIIQTANSGFARSIAYLPGVGPYSGVIAWSLDTVVIVTIVIWLATLKLKKQAPVATAGWVLVVCALIQAVAFFPPVYEPFIH
jgi:hypothetical protein